MEKTVSTWGMLPLLALDMEESIAFSTELLLKEITSKFYHTVGRTLPSSDYFLKDSTSRMVTVTKFETLRSISIMHILGRERS